MARIRLRSLQKAASPFVFSAGMKIEKRFPNAIWQRQLGSSSNMRATHRTYFQPDSHVGQQSVPSQSQHEPFSSPTPNARTWTFLLIGFAAFPVFWLTLENIAVRGMLPDFVVYYLFPNLTSVDETVTMADQIRHLEDAASRYSEMHQATQRIFREHLTAAPNSKRSVVRDDDIIARRPIFLDDGQQIAPKDASLLRVVDDAGHNTLVVLGVNLNAYTSQHERVDTDIRGLHRWIYQLVEDMHGAGATAFNTEGETMYILYTNNAIAMGPFYVSSLNDMSSHTEIIAVDSLLLPPGWPLKQLRRVASCEQTEERVKAKDGGPPGFTAQGLLGSETLPHGPFR